MVDFLLNLFLVLALGWLGLLLLRMVPMDGDLQRIGRLAIIVVVAILVVRMIVPFVGGL